MPRRKIFLSHSTKARRDDSRAEIARADAAFALLTAVAAELRARGYDVLLDRDTLTIGDRWYDQVSQWMMEADGALLLWNKDAKASDYVRHEASIVSHRWRTEQGNFRLCVANIDDSPIDERLRKGDLSGPFLSPTRIGDAHSWSMPEAMLGAPIAERAAAIRDEVIGAFGVGAYDHSWRDLLIKRLTWALEEGLGTRGLETLRTVVQRAAKQARAQPADAGADEIVALETLIDHLPTRNLCRIVAGWLADEAPVRFEAIDWLCSYLLTYLRDPIDLKKAIRIAQSAWIGVRGACPIGQTVRMRNRGGMAALNGGAVAAYTLDQFWLGALDPGREPRTIICNDMSLGEAAVVDELRSMAGVPTSANDDDINDELGSPTICLLPRDYPAGSHDEALIRSLAGRFPGVLFVAWPGAKGDALLRFPAIPAIAPPIELDEEQRHYAAWRRFHRE